MITLNYVETYIGQEEKGVMGQLSRSRETGLFIFGTFKHADFENRSFLWIIDFDLLQPFNF